MKASRNSAWEGRFRPDGLVHGNEIYDDVGHQVCRSIGCMHELVWISGMDLVVAISDKDSWRKRWRDERMKDRYGSSKRRRHD